jgi:ethylmalonyl-CoA mutase
MMRTYSGHSTARASNELYRTNLTKGQTGLSIAFDLPTQTGYDPDHLLARGEVGKVGVPIVHKGHMSTLPVDKMNTSMTINAPAAWMLGLYVANAEDHGVSSNQLRGTTQNDIVKEYLSRGTYIFPPAESRRLIVDMFAFCTQHVPFWNPMNVCSYHLQEAGATPVQEIAYSLSTAVRSTPIGSPTSWLPFRSSSMPVSGSSRRPARCERSPRCGIASASSGTASPTPRRDDSDTACR